ncbi:acyltransferase, partial [bacterium]|nr:acyltransferase [bacterium]
MIQTIWPLWRKDLHDAFNLKVGRDWAVLDGLRGVGILGILAGHCFLVAAVMRKGVPEILTFLDQLPPYLRFITSLDKTVDIFFMLSSYLSGSALFIEWNKNQSISYSAFYIKRFFRIAPVYYLSIFLFGVFQVEKLKSAWASNFLFFSNYTRDGLVLVGWSLCVEMQFFLILPFILRGVLALRESMRLSALWILYFLSVAVLGITLLEYPVIYESTLRDFSEDKQKVRVLMNQLYYFSHTRMGPFMLGLVWAYLDLYRDRLKWPRVFSKDLTGLAQAFWGGIGAALIVVSLHFPVLQVSSPYYEGFDPRLNFVLHVLHRNAFSIGFLVLMIQMGIFEVKTGTAGAMQRFFSKKIWRGLSQVAFPMYLFHFPMMIPAA